MLDKSNSTKAFSWHHKPSNDELLATLSSYKLLLLQFKSTNRLLLEIFNEYKLESLQYKVVNVVLFDKSNSDISVSEQSKNSSELKPSIPVRS